MSLQVSLRIARVFNLDPYTIAVVQVRRHIFEHLKATQNQLTSSGRATRSKVFKSDLHAIRNRRRAYF